MHDLGDGDKVKQRAGRLAYITCAKPQEEEVVDKVLFLGHAKFLRS